jgi:uncharacterized tellurite resistance protein B-like protein
MLDALKRLLDRPAPDQGPSPPDREHQVRVATAALLFEAVRADGTVEEAERTVMRAAVQSTFDLQPDELDELVGLAQDASARAVSLYELTQVVNAAFTPDEKKRIVELLWVVAFADARKDALEEHLIRKVARLLAVAHPDFIDAKLRARSSGAGAR